MEVANTKYVWWDMDCCQVPRGRDPYEVRWIIESALNKKYGPGPVTIFAIGNLNRILGRVLELISRAGIVIKHTCYGGLSITNDLVTWTYTHPPPAILMLISDREFHYDESLEIVKSDGYTILRTYVNQKPDSPTYASDVWLWKSLLTDTTTRQQELQGKCCETGDWYCMLCGRGGQSFTDFTTHCKTRQHLIWEWFTVVDRDPFVSEPTDKDLASLHSRLMTHTVKQTKPRKHFGWHGQHKLKKSHTEPGKVKLLSEPHKGPMLKFISESCKDIGSFIAAIKQESHTVPRDCSVVPSDKDLKHKKQSKPHKHVGSHLKGRERKLKESHWVPRNWDAGPSEEVQAFSSLDLST